MVLCEYVMDRAQIISETLKEIGCDVNNDVFIQAISDEIIETAEEYES